MNVWTELAKALDDLEKGGPGSGNFGHPGYPRGVDPEHHNVLSSFGYKHTGTENRISGVIHHYSGPNGHTASHLAGRGQTFLNGPGGSTHILASDLKQALKERHDVSPIPGHTSGGKPYGPPTGQFGNYRHR